MQSRNSRLTSSYTLSLVTAMLCARVSTVLIDIQVVLDVCAPLTEHKLPRVVAEHIVIEVTQNVRRMVRTSS